MAPATRSNGPMRPPHGRDPCAGFRWLSVIVFVASGAVAVAVSGPRGMALGGFIYMSHFCGLLVLPRSARVIAPDAPLTPRRRAYIGGVWALTAATVLFVWMI